MSDYYKSKKIFEKGDIIRCSNSRDYIAFRMNEETQVLKVKYNYNDQQLIWIKPKNSSATWFLAKNFTFVRKSKSEETMLMNNMMYLVYKLTEILKETEYPDDPENGKVEKYEIREENMLGDIPFTSEKAAKDAIAKLLEESPEDVYGIFPLAAVAKVERPPIKFYQIGKR